MFFRCGWRSSCSAPSTTIRIIARAPPPEGVSITCHQALAWGTLGGARAAGLEDRIGSLTPGKQADLVLIRSDGINFAGWDEKNPAACVMLQAHVGNVDTVLVAGEIVKQHGRLRADVAAAVRRLRDSARYVASRSNELAGTSADKYGSRKYPSGLTGLPRPRADAPSNQSASPRRSRKRVAGIEQARFTATLATNIQPSAS